MRVGKKQNIHKWVTAPKIAPNTTINKTIPIRDITRPAMARPFGCRVKPTAENINPNIHTIQPKNGTQPKNNAIKARTNPAVPIPLDFSV